MREYQKEWIKKRREAWFESKGNQCAQCGSEDRLELDHIDPSKKVSHRIWCWAEERRLEELAKCQPLCYGCHQAKTRIDKKEMFPVRHGENAGYDSGCRLKCCRDAHAETERNRRVRIKEVTMGA